MKICTISLKNPIFRPESQAKKFFWFVFSPLFLTVPAGMGKLFGRNVLLVRQSGSTEKS
jgi:hypothetical protein